MCFLGENRTFKIVGLSKKNINFLRAGEYSTGLFEAVLKI